MKRARALLGLAALALLVTACGGSGTGTSGALTEADRLRIHLGA